MLVDFWAPWCGPCRMLTPVLEELTREMDGAFVLAKADAEAHPAVGQRVSVRSIPAVKLFVGGAVVGEFIGALPGSQVRGFLDTHLPSAADDLVHEAEALLGTDNAGARGRLRQALDERPNHPRAHWLLANIAFTNEERPFVEHHTETIPNEDPLPAKGQALLRALTSTSIAARSPRAGARPIRARRTSSRAGDAPRWPRRSSCARLRAHRLAILWNVRDVGRGTRCRFLESWPHEN